MKSVARQPDLDGRLVDYIAKGTKAELEGTEKVEGSPAYKLKLTLKNGVTEHVWIDAQSFLQVKIEGTPRRLDGKYHPVLVYLRDYKTVAGVLVPYTLETVVEGVPGTEKILIENVQVNPKIDDAQFARVN